MYIYIVYQIVTVCIVDQIVTVYSVYQIVTVCSVYQIVTKLLMVFLLEFFEKVNFENSAVDKVMKNYPEFLEFYLSTFRMFFSSS